MTSDMEKIPLSPPGFPSGGSFWLNMTQLWIPENLAVSTNKQQAHAGTCPVVDILKATQQGAARVRYRCSLLCTRWGAHWRHL